MKKLILLLSIFFSCSITSCKSIEPAKLNYQNHDSFTSAIKRSTDTVNEYVLIQLTNINDNSTSNVCVTANLFMGAIHREYELDYSNDDLEKAYEIVISNKSHHFTFSKLNAIANMPFNHSGSDVALIQKFIKHYTLAELEAGLKKHTLYNEVKNNQLITNHFNGKHYLVFSGALACALIDRGFRVNDGFGLTIINE